MDDSVTKNAKRYEAWRAMSCYSREHATEWDEYLDRIIEKKEKENDRLRQEAG